MMGDRDKQKYNEDSPGNINDYWSSSSSYNKERQALEAEREANIEYISTKEDWLFALAKALADEDDYFVAMLRETANNWSHDEKARFYMLKIVDNILNLQTHW